MNRFHPTHALRLAKHVASACAGVKPIIGNVSSDTQCGVYRDGDAFVFAFPGTASRRDVLTDLRCAKVPFRVRASGAPGATESAGRVHAGFCSANESIDEELFHTAPKDARLIFAGHSLGGALAMLAALRFARAGAHVLGVYTFGQPRVGNGTWARTYNQELHDITWRVVNARDPVPHIPWQLGTYRHCGREVFLPEDGPVQIERGWWSLLSEKLTLPPDGEEHREFLSRSAHTLHAYITRLARLAHA